MKHVLRLRLSLLLIGLVSLLALSAMKVARPTAPIRLGFIPLTDCAPLVVAKELGLFKKYGVEVELSKESSWANVRDKVLNGELEGAHCLMSIPLSVYTGIGGKAGSEMKIAMVLNNNGQAITMSKDFCGLLGFNQIGKVASAVQTVEKTKPVTFAMTFLGGTHDVWLRYWLTAAGVPMKSVGIITIPPPQMVANMRVGSMQGFSVGEPWGSVAADQGVGFTELASQDLWKNHPEKALVVNSQFAATRREDLKKVMMAVIEASRWLDDMKNRKQAAAWLSKTYYVNAPEADIESRLMGTNNLGCTLGTHKYTDDYMKFYNNGFVNMPRKAHVMWFLAQYMRFGLLKSAPDYQGIANKLVLSDIYAEVAKAMKAPMPTDEMKPIKTNFDIVFDPTNIPAYLAKTKKSM